MIDFYSELREPAYNSNVPTGPGAATAGRFDPLLSLVLLDPTISDLLDTRKGALPAVALEAGGSAAVRAYATALHETIHWWQHVGSTAGLLSGLTTAAQAALCAKHMSDLGIEAPKPLLGALESKRYRPADENHPAWRAALRWREAELGNAFLVNPVLAFAKVRANPFLYESIGHSVLMHHCGVTWHIAQVADPGGGVFPDADAWIGLYERSVKDGLDLFEPDTLAELPIGARDLFEGQARLSELQFYDRAVEPRALSEFKQMGLFERPYSRCFDNFLKTIESPPPEGVQSPEVNLFPLVCDIAINPSAGYPLTIPDGHDLVSDNHPGCRFLKLAAVARDNKGALLPLLGRLSHGHYKQAAAILTEPLGWLPPDEVARQVFEGFGWTTAGSKLIEGRETGEFGVQDVPTRFVLAEHVGFSEWKAGCPHFFCWPGMYLTSDQGDDAPETQAIKELIDRTSPPFYASAPQSGVDTVSIHGLSGAQAKGVADRYFQYQATVDLFRQWVSRRAEGDGFDYQFAWKPRISGEEIANLKSSFRATFGVDIDSIRRLS